MWYINFRTNNLDTFTVLEIKGYKVAKLNYNKLIDSGYVDVTLSDEDGIIIFENEYK